MPLERLQKILAAAGITSRRKSETLISEGRVTVNGKVITELGSKADAGADRIELDGVRVRVPKEKLYILLYKPKGVVSTMSDPQGRPTVKDLLGDFGERVFHVGRLDVNSEGLLLLTNDGDLALRVSHPRYGCRKTYQVKVHGIPDEQTLDKLRKGVVIDGRRTAPAEVIITAKTGRDGNTWLSVTLSEGRSRQVRRMFEALGHPVSKLNRVSVGPLKADGLKRGGFRFLQPAEVASLGGKSRSVARPRVRR